MSQPYPWGGVNASPGRNAIVHGSRNEAAALCGNPDEITRKLEMLQSVGVTYVLASMSGGLRDSLRRFAREIAPSFTASVSEAR